MQLFGARPKNKLDWDSLMTYKKRAWRWGVLLAVCGSACALFFLNARGVSKQSVEDLVRNSLSKQATEEEVRVFLAQNGFTRVVNLDQAKLLDLVPNLPGVDEQRISKCILVSIPGRHVDLLSQEVVRVIFYFDSEKRLLGHSVESKVMSP